MTEVSCNLFSMYTVGGMGNESRLKAQGNYASARKNIVEREPKGSYLACPDVFDRLVPFWQLHLYFSCNGRPDFYADVMERMRRRPDAGTGNDSVRNQFEFVKLCCDMGQLDLTDFFDKWGFFWVGTLTVDDYGKFNITITQEMVDETRSYIAKKRYQKPSADLTQIEEERSAGPQGRPRFPTQGAIAPAGESAHVRGSHRAGPHPVGLRVADELGLEEIELQVPLQLLADVSRQADAHGPVHDFGVRHRGSA